LNGADLSQQRSEKNDRESSEKQKTMSDYVGLCCVMFDVSKKIDFLNFSFLLKVMRAVGTISARRRFSTQSLAHATSPLQWNLSEVPFLSRFLVLGFVRC
jgi:hypothetical protein